jgi:hypothetical protein
MTKRGARRPSEYDGKRVIAVFGDGTGVIWNVDPVAWGRKHAGSPTGT